jgi:hypothetical protein
MRSLQSNSTEIMQPPKPFVDTSQVLYCNDGTVTTVAREQRLDHLLVERQRNLNVDPLIAAGWFNGLVIVTQVTPAEVVEHLEAARANIDEAIQANMPTPIELN